ncbi:MAG TPA: efflux RND transporter periplasmic adaptor subunit [Vicinamibacterales bacterium]|nr:efflux RND transporter periplasmic adaptor subunit [Vicinamibacterales bacterium]
MNQRAVSLAVVLAVAVSACSRSSDPASNEPPALNVTHWTERTELYMEYPPLVAGRTALFAVHLTTLADFKPVTSGQARVEFTPGAGGQPTALEGPQPSRPGAFRVEGAAPAAGRYRWALVLNAPGLSDRHDLGAIEVFADEPTANAEASKRPAEDAAAISYLKEQQWTNEFATTPVQDADVRTSIRVPAVLHPMPGGEAVVAAPAPGRVVAEELPSIGDRVRAGEVLARLEPRLSASDDRATLEAAVEEAQIAVEAAHAEQTRAERLLAERAVPGRRVEDAGRATTVAEARLKAARARLAQRDETLRTGGGAAAGNAFVLHSPIAGRITEVAATLGAAYDEGTPLFKIVRTDALELNVFVPAPDVTTARGVAAVSLELPGRADPLPLRFHHVHDPGVLDEATRALAVQMEVQNPGGQLLVGQAGTAILYTGAQQRLPTVPKAAVLMEAGRPYVFVQVGGERFARRFVEIASRDGDVVGLKGGVKPGERVVTRGAYEVQLASAAKGLPAEGHVH